MILTIEEARALLAGALRKTGYDAEEIRIISDHLIDCELRGLSFGGLPRALSVIERTLAAPVPRRPITVVKESAVSASIDGGDHVGYLVAQRATDIAIVKARESGIAMVGAHETWYTGMFSWYLEQVTAAGFVGMVAGSGGPRVAPHGGTEGRFSTNPIAFGFPSSGHPVIWDIGTSAVMLGEVVLRERLGELLPEGLAFAPDGSPTRDPSAALAGAFTVWGGHKGSGLAMVVQLLGMLAGAPAAPEKLRDCGFFLLVLDPAALTSPAAFKGKVDGFAESLRDTRPLDPQQLVRVPFERSAREREARRVRNQIDVADAVYLALTAFAQDANPAGTRP
ncbi:LDH2 family malate/lactate/ureidoglycolate dehydrogenase [Paraburkholderia unamae]|uniref:Ldh family oxidoreductase n=1 Tax=Paraburkholderia unamae TaxID=219649 RepID=UPI000DC55B4A|nr:Ldh family oxidoreductase [Paraburkholderia unamae]RAR56413.1 LDH2 family malate/lactate/ureidoglycolate dehydrogenase [Paraburkholderia unamae]